MERYTKYKRKSSYLYFGLIFAALALLMIAVSVHEFMHGESFILRITGFGAGVMWGAAAFVCLRNYYKANLSELSSLGRKNRSDTNEL